ncbi:hypothetical protein IF1G_03563 [Cordyceps javanica]|uniref:G domain-containing protein n=1 Tax=Cordyceps javanica TaxID=43265 RepID=A0A545W4U8_9HYPO|nr:hypothetical protein IF1G_03563 [Cordyceps javanica]TQW09004.1 50S ribosome-binding GTPase domain-containing protein [Cordyceps javanica]
MASIGISAAEWEASGEQVLAFLGARKPRRDDRFILVMGTTGSGKSTFISEYTNKRVVIGHGLYSCTGSVKVFDSMQDGRCVYMIDTPGFNDTDRPDAEVLQTLATYLGASAICGFRLYRNLTIATTKWPFTPSRAEYAMCRDREAELKYNAEFYGDLVRRGATMVRHSQVESGHYHGGTVSAHHIVERLLRQSDIYGTPVLQLQLELVDQNLAIFHTTAGEIVNSRLDDARRDHERQLRELKEQMRSSQYHADASHRRAQQDLNSVLMADLHRYRTDQQALVKNMRDIHEDEQRLWRARIENLERQFSRQLKYKEQELRDMEEYIDRKREDATRRRRDGREQYRAASEAEGYEQIISELRQETKAAAKALKKLRGQTQNIVYGGANSLASGVASVATAAAAGAGALVCTIM